MPKRRDSLELTPNEQIVVARLAEGQTPAQISQSTGLDRSYVHRVAKRPAVVTLVAAQTSHDREAWLRNLADLVPLALSTAREMLLAPDTPAVVRAKLVSDILTRGAVTMEGARPQADTANPSLHLHLSPDAAKAAVARLKQRTPYVEAEVEADVSGDAEPQALPRGGPDPE